MTEADRCRSATDCGSSALTSPVALASARFMALDDSLDAGCIDGDCPKMSSEPSKGRMLGLDKLLLRDDPPSADDVLAAELNLV